MSTTNISDLLKDLAEEQNRRELISPLTPKERLRCTCGHYIKYHTISVKTFTEIVGSKDINGVQMAITKEVNKAGQFCKYNCPCKGFKPSSKQDQFKKRDKEATY